MAEYDIERYVNLLAERMEERVTAMSEALSPKGKRPPFTKQLSRKQALNWWRKHRYDELGAMVLRNMDQNSILELDQELTRQNELRMLALGELPLEEELV